MVSDKKAPVVETVAILTLATFAPEAAARIQDPVEMFTVLTPSSPVPTISRDPGTVCTGVARL